MSSSYHTPVQTTLVTPQVQGTLTVSPGSAGIPAVVFADDSDSGFFHPAPDSVGIATGGTERMRITPAGQLILQHTASLPNAWGAHCGLQANNPEGAAFSRWEDNPYGSNVYFQKSRGAPGDLRAVKAGDGLARIIHQRFGTAVRRRVDGWRQRRGMTGLDSCGDRLVRGHIAPAFTAAA